MENNQQVPVPPLVPGDAPTPAKSNKRNITTIAAGVAVVILAAAGWFAYGAYSKSPEKVWKKFVQSEVVPKVSSQSFNFTYEDKGKISGVAMVNPMLGMFSGLKFSVKGDGYSDATDPLQPKVTGEVNYSFGTGDTSISAKAKFVMPDKDVVYFSLGNNPIVNRILAMVSPDEKVEWIKLDMKKMQELVNEKQPEGSGNADFLKLAKNHEEIVKRYLPKLIVMEKFIDKQEVRGAATLHYANKLDKNEAKAMMREAWSNIVKEAKSSGEKELEEIAKIEKFVYGLGDALIDRLEITVFETWVGVRDSKLHKVKFASNAPSLVALISSTVKNDSIKDEEQDPEKLFQMVLESMLFEGVINIEQEFYDFGVVKEVKAPAKFFDLYEAAPAF